MTTRTRQRFGRMIVGGALFQRLRTRALEYVRNPDKLADLISNATRRADSAGKAGPLQEIWDSFMALLRLVRAYARGEYRDISLPQLLLIVAGVLYFVVPTDVIPDFIIGLGLLDDVAVLGWILTTLKSAVDDFLVWEAARSTRPSGNTD